MDAIQRVVHSFTYFILLKKLADILSNDAGELLLHTVKGNTWMPNYT